MVLVSEAYTGIFFMLQTNCVKINLRHAVSVLMLDMRTGTFCFQNNTAYKIIRIILYCRNLCFIVVKLSVLCKCYFFIFKIKCHKFFVLSCERCTREKRGRRFTVDKVVSFGFSVARRFQISAR